MRLFAVIALIALAAIFSGCADDNAKCRELYYTDREISDEEGYWFLENCTIKNGEPVAQ